MSVDVFGLPLRMRYECIETLFVHGVAVCSAVDLALIDKPVFSQRIKIWIQSSMRYFSIVNRFDIILNFLA